MPPAAIPANALSTAPKEGIESETTLTGSKPTKTAAITKAKSANA